MQSERNKCILIVDDDDDVLYTARLVLRGLFQKVDTLTDPGLIPELLKAVKYDIILLDMNFTRGITTGKEGLEWLQRILIIDPDVRVLTTTAYGDINLAVLAMKMGAVDFILKPWNKEGLVTSIAGLLRQEPDQVKTQKTRNQQTKTNGFEKTKCPEIISRSPEMRHVLEIIKTVAPTDANILILGENGTGKELAAWTLHRQSLRNKKPFIHVDLGAISETLFEAELFGHTRGAFTDAKEERSGRFEAASGGTLFLDEIGNLSLPLQAKILTAIQNREVVRIGSNNQIPVDIRLISATNMPLYQMADSFNFRQDLLYRINTVEINLPPLRDRKEDIRPIAEYYLDFYSNQYNRHGITIEENAIRKLTEYPWPGNIRELAHSVERAVILCKGKLLTPDDFILKTKNIPDQEIEGNIIRVEDYEKKAICKALDKHNGNLSKAAGDLGIARSTLYRKIARFGIDNLFQSN